MRYLGLDLGTKTLGVAITDKTGLIANFFKVIRFSFEDYDQALNEVLEIIKDKGITKIALGLPKNMNNTMGFASVRSINFKKMLEKKTDVPVYLVDERLSTVEAQNILKGSNINHTHQKKVIDGVAAQIILETFIKMEGNKHE